MEARAAVARRVIVVRSFRCGRTCSPDWLAALEHPRVRAVQRDNVGLGPQRALRVQAPPARPPTPGFIVPP